MMPLELAAAAQFDVGTALSQALASVLVPSILLSPFLIRYWRRKLAAEASRDEATADETDAKAQVLLSGEALSLFRTARDDAVESRKDAREARAESERCRRDCAHLRVRVDAYDRHLMRLEALMIEARMAVPDRPEIIAHRHTT